MDVLDDILSTLNLKGVLYFRTDFSGPWATTVPDLPGAARFHLVIQGECHITLKSGEHAVLRAGDLVLVPGGASHVLSDMPGRAAPPLETVLESLGYDGSGVLAIGDSDPHASTQMVCGHFSFREGADHPLLRMLPQSLITHPADRAKEPLLDETLRLIVKWIFVPKAGSSAAVKRLSEIAFIELLRIGATSEPAMKSMLTALNDKQIGASLALMHAEPEKPWTIETLASEVGMSRSRFAERFRDLLDLSPMAYLSDWRLQKALSLLDDSRCSVQEVASQTGYQSPAAFTRAFSAKFGKSPTNYRREIA